MGTHGWAYRRRQPEGTVLYEAVRENLATLLAEASEVGRGLPRYVERDFARYLECGVLVHGFARVRCESCKDELLVAFSCSAVFALQRRRARRQGIRHGQAGAALVHPVLRLGVAGNAALPLRQRSSPHTLLPPATPQ